MAQQKKDKVEKLKYRISDSNVFFDLKVQDLVKESHGKDVQLKMIYSLTNTGSERIQIPAQITHFAYLKEGRSDNQDNKRTIRIFSDKVTDVKTGKIMMGYGDDHHVVFEPEESREFIVHFQPAKIEFDGVDLEFYVKPGNRKFGPYLLTYDFDANAVTRCTEFNE